MLGNGYVIESNKYTTHVTGIPYNYDFNAVRGDSNWLGWTPNGASWKNASLSTFKRICLNKGFMVSPKHGVPSTTVGIVAELKCQAYLKKATFTMGATNATNTKSTSGSGQSVGSTAYNDVNLATSNASVKTYNIDISSSVPYIYASSDIDNACVFNIYVKYR